MGFLGVGSQIDGLAHAGVDGMYYNCNFAGDFVQGNGVAKLGIEHVPNIATRGVLLDMTQHFNSDPLPQSTSIDAEALSAQAKKQGIEIGQGDVVLIHTGWMKAYLGVDDAMTMGPTPGLNLDGAKYLSSKGVVAVGSDGKSVGAGVSSG